MSSSIELFHFYKRCMEFSKQQGADATVRTNNISLESSFKFLEFSVGTMSKKANVS